MKELVPKASSFLVLLRLIVPDYSRTHNTDKSRLRLYLDVHQIDYSHFSDYRLAPSEVILKAKRDYMLEKLNNSCVDCGETDPRILEFDHIEEGTKRNNVSYFLCRGSLQEFIDEVDKCEVVCCNCHALRTYSRDETHVRHLIYKELMALKDVQYSGASRQT
jgi:hypothetical protein